MVANKKDPHLRVERGFIVDTAMLGAINYANALWWPFHASICRSVSRPPMLVNQRIVT
jgi:hypothetical protein